MAARNGSARVISVRVRYLASHRRSHHLQDDLGINADRTGLLKARRALKQRSTPWRHGPIMPVPQERWSVTAASVREAAVTDQLFAPVIPSAAGLARSRPGRTGGGRPVPRADPVASSPGQPL